MTRSHLWTRTTKRGFLCGLYNQIRRRVDGRLNSGPEYTGLPLLPRTLFFAWSLSNPTFNRLWDTWQEAERLHKLAPSIDRINTTGGYVLGNIQWLSHGANSGKTSQGPGERGHNSKLTNADAAQIRQRVTSGEKQNRIAVEFNVSPMVISNITRNKTYK